MTHNSKPLTFAAMLIRAQRRFEAFGRPFPAARGSLQARDLLQTAGPALRHGGATGLASPLAPTLRPALVG